MRQYQWLGIVRAVKWAVVLGPLAKVVEELSGPLKRTLWSTSEEGHCAVTLLRSIRHWSWNMTTMIVSRGLSELENVTTEGPRGEKSLQWRKGRPEFIERRPLNPFHQYEVLHLSLHISANFRDRNGSVRPNKVQRASFCFSITISCFHDSIRTEFEDPVADVL
jgi:hypothetical protein